jgi:sigma-B regulation protein RsbU (phosphoserine phosphatase)
MNLAKLEDGSGVESISLGRYYGIVAVSTTISICVVIILNLSTPLDLFPGKLVKIALSDTGSSGTAIYAFFIKRFLAVFFLPYSLIFLSLRMLLGPIRDYIRDIKSGQQPGADLLQRARQRLLNLSYLFIPVNVGFWILIPAVIFLLACLTGEMDLRTGLILSARTSMVGLITSAVSFHRIENHSRRNLIPFFFPNGHLHELKGAARISISKRIRMLYRIGSVVPMMILVVTLLTLQWQVGSSPISAKDYGQGILSFTLILCAYFFISSGILNRATTRSITQPLEEIIHVLRGVRRGNFGKKVKVVSNDEIGYAGDIINEMTEGLQERDRIRHSLELAMEVQQSLLPGEDPRFDGLDISGRSIYCDETGGDYWDFIEFDGVDKKRKIGIVLGDVSGHGISSALLMATARAFIRQRSSLPGSISEILTDVNRQLYRDVKDSGDFVTLFYMIIDVSHKRLNWVRAGHEPAIFYDPDTDRFEELKGPGMALGIDETFTFVENEKSGLSKGQIIVLCTDGIFEARNSKGEMFGKKSVFDIIRKNSAATSGEILSALTASLRQFQTGRVNEDDVTLAVIKIE